MSVAIIEASAGCGRMTWEHIDHALSAPGKSGNERKTGGAETGEVAWAFGAGPGVWAAGGRSVGVVARLLAQPTPTRDAAPKGSGSRHRRPARCGSRREPSGGGGSEWDARTCEGLARARCGPGWQGRNRSCERGARCLSAAGLPLPDLRREAPAARAIHGARLGSARPGGARGNDPSRVFGPMGPLVVPEGQRD